MAFPTRARLAALLTVPAVSMVVLAGCGDDDPKATDPGDRPSQSGKPSTSPSQGGDPSPTESGSATPTTVAAPLYFVGETPQGPRLFREFQQVEADNPVDEALAVLTAGAAKDPDYRSLLPEGTPTLVQGDNGEAIGVNIPVEWADRPSGMSAKEATLAIQQIVFTVQGVLQSRAPVEFYSDGLTPVFGVDKSSFKAAQRALALVNVTQPEEGSSPGDSFTASGVANSFEATVPWEVRDQDGKKVLDGFSTAEGWGDKLYPWQTEVDVSSLPPGTYSFVAMTDDPSGGEGGGPTEDSKTITVQ
ncbi:MAG TPA: Gmad2 immunoglobulin-like domain-containing protein [Nocardioides sp.]|uniref:Gmad2 immunoglobulin-like domain-containing protein n=1 Tax=Nocardioides sp. TaxID=35761 RepID=UPI002E365CC9|nr:Gmad2 immunoglobulin-like domain-containing protein [Nocardioides sp.]HEX5089170.1 Gmad2 immunoglobulin-like domain-containing protein [Nocardioides sp.]